MSEERERRDRERSHLQHEAEHSRPRKKVAVVSYLAILFGAAFLLLLLSYFMQQRASEQAISGLQNSVNSIQSVETLVDTNKRLSEENKELTAQADALSDQIEALEKNAAAAQKATGEQEKQLQSMDWFWRIQRAYSKGSKSEAKTLVEQFEATGLPASLPTTSTAATDGPSPAEQYDALLAALGMQKATP